MKYVLGGGIAGLIWAYYNDDYFIISPEVGGQMKSEFNLGPRYLHDNETSRKFLSDLGMTIENRKSKIRIGYLDEDGQWVKAPDAEYRKKYYLKSRKTTSLDGFDPSVMNGNKNEFDILTVDFQEIIAALSWSIGSARFVDAWVEKVDRTENTVHMKLKSGDKATARYDHLVSTMPIKFFAKAVEPKLDLDPTFDSYDMTYVYCKPDAFEWIQDSGFDYVYDLRSSTPYHRITKEKEGYVLDFFGKISDEDLATYKNLIIDYKTLKDAQLISREDVKDLEDVKFVGRYGTWDRKWKTEKVIEEAMKFK